MNGEVNIRKTHPNLFWLVMIQAVAGAALGLNFIGGTLSDGYPSPTFPIFGAPNALWGVIFLALSAVRIMSLTIIRRMRLVRALIAFSTVYTMFLAFGTMQPWIEGKGSLQLPILYAAMSALQMPLLLEPFVNPWTAKR